MTPGAWVLVQGRGHTSRLVKMHYLFFNVLLYSQAQIRQTNNVVMMTIEGLTKIENVITPGAGVPVQGRGHISHTVNMQYMKSV